MRRIATTTLVVLMAALSNCSSKSEPVARLGDAGGDASQTPEPIETPDSSDPVIDEDAGDGSTCPAECAAQDAVGQGADTCPLGYRFTGTTCSLVRGCTGCVGVDCDKLMKFDDCRALEKKCANLCT